MSINELAVQLAMRAQDENVCLVVIARSDGSFQITRGDVAPEEPENI